MALEKRCHLCGLTKPVHDFHKGSGRYGVRGRCKACINSNRRKWHDHFTPLYALNPDRLAAYRAELHGVGHAGLKRRTLKDKLK